MICSPLFPIALHYFAIHLHIPTSCLLTVLSVQLSCFTLFWHSFTYTGIPSLYCFVSCLALLYFAIHLHIPTSCLLTVLSVQLHHKPDWFKKSSKIPKGAVKCWIVDYYSTFLTMIQMTSKFMQSVRNLDENQWLCLHESIVFNITGYVVIRLDVTVDVWELLVYRICSHPSRCHCWYLGVISLHDMYSQPYIV